jgi:Fic family protein
MFVRQEAVQSSQIEGTQASLVDILEFEADSARRNLPGDVSEVVNYVHAMNYGLSRLRELPLSQRLIGEIHAELLHNVRGANRHPGEFRTSQNWIGAGNVSIQHATFVPPPPEEMFRALGDLESYLHDPTPMPILLKTGLVHAQFETIHPFLDGNGRMGRLLVTFLLVQQDVLNRPLLYLSYYLKKHRATYYDLLQRVRTEGDWESWLKFFLKGVDEVATTATEIAREILRMRESQRELIRDRASGPANALHLLDHLFEQPILTANRAAELLGVTYPTANKLLSQLESLGLLREVTGGARNRLFAYQPYLDLFERGRPDVPSATAEAILLPRTRAEETR